MCDYVTSAIRGPDNEPRVDQFNRKKRCYKYIDISFFFTQMDIILILFTLMLWCIQVSMHVYVYQGCFILNLYIIIYGI